MDKKRKIVENPVGAASAPIEPFFEAYMKDPEFQRAYEELELEFEIVRQLIELRLAGKIT